MALNGGMRMEYTNAVSFVIDCADLVSTAPDGGMLTDETVSDDTLPDGGCS